jgi:hypothetical protein
LFSAVIRLERSCFLAHASGQRSVKLAFAFGDDDIRGADANFHEMIADTMERLAAGRAV